MPPRLPLLPTHALHLRSPRPTPSASFHTSKPWNSDNIDPYATLQVPHNASAASIKKQFYALSTLHHPDHNPHDPTASERFVKISSAYAILGHADTRARYDRDHIGSPSPRHPRSGTHSSSSHPNSPHGARPASGLSRRRTPFHGPPPSFYRSGGWGPHSAKRAAAASGASGASGAFDASSHAASASAGAAGGGAAFMRAGWNDVPHFDREGHRWTQEQHERRRRRRMEAEGAADGRAGGGGVVWNFLFVTGVVVLAGCVPGVWGMAGARRRREDG